MLVCPAAGGAPCICVLTFLLAAALVEQAQCSSWPCCSPLRLFACFPPHCPPTFVQLLAGRGGSVPCPFGET